MHARLDRGDVRLLTRTGLDWTHKYPPVAAAVASLRACQAYLDGELCGVFPDGITSFSMIQAASDAGNTAGLVYFIFDLLHLDGEDISPLPLIERKARLPELLSGAAPPLHYSDYHRGEGTSPPGKYPQLINAPGSETGPGPQLVTWGKSTILSLDAHGFKFEYTLNSAKHIPFDWGGP